MGWALRRNIIAALLSLTAFAGGVGEADAADTGALRDTMLRHHNGERSRLRVPALAWDDRLAASATAHAAKLADAGALSHAKQSGSRPFGENIWMGTRGSFTLDEMVGSFIAERAYYTGGAVPEISATGVWSDAAHYSQMIWRATTRVGCGLASGPDHDVLVCRYDPAGNVWGQRADEGRGLQVASRRLMASDSDVN